MAVYSYLLCASNGEALWLGKRLLDGFWRASTPEEQVSTHAFRFLHMHTCVNLIVLDEDDISEEFESIHDVSAERVPASIEFIHLECSCGAQQDLRAADVTRWLNVHYGHEFVCKDPA
jgi:hypothetical protein